MRTVRSDNYAGVWPLKPSCGPVRRSGSAMLSPAVWGRIAINLGLSTRELQIVRGTFDDQTESAIAMGLQISVNTVHTHIGRLHHKLGVTDRAQLILRVMREYMALTASAGHRSPSRSAGGNPGRRPATVNCKPRDWRL